MRNLFEIQLKCDHLTSNRCNIRNVGCGVEVSNYVAGGNRYIDPPGVARLSNIRAKGLGFKGLGYFQGLQGYRVTRF
jgi:hypothetical protein